MWRNRTDEVKVFIRKMSFRTNVSGAPPEYQVVGDRGVGEGGAS